MGKKNELVAWLEDGGNTLVISRLFRAEKFECRYVHKLLSASELEVTIIFTGSDGNTITSVQKFKKD